MDFRKVLGDYAPVDSLWLPIFEGNDNIRLHIKSPKHWLENLTKIMDKNRNSTVMKSTSLYGKKDVVISNNNDDEKNNFFTGSLNSDIDFLLENVVIDWKGIDDENGNPIEFSKENAKRTLFNEEFKGVRELTARIFFITYDGKIFNENQAELYKEAEEVVKK